LGFNRLAFTGVRNLQPLDLRGLGGINLFFGPNGSGKTSVLEGIFLLGMARSFRTQHARNVIRHGQDECTVYGEWRSDDGSGPMTPVGVSRTVDGSVQIRIGGRNVRAVSELAELLPMQVINAQGFELLAGPPAERRQYLDWGVFHVEHGYQASWQRFQRSIKQRNSLLRHGKIASGELATWDHEFAVAGEQVDEGRRAYFERLLTVFKELASRLSPDLEGMELRYRRGWDREQSLSDALAATAVSDREQGYTHVGPQRADIRLLHDGHAAGETLSRGQQKLVVCALKLAQGLLLSRQRGRSCVYLVDDLPAELDANHCGLVAGVLSELNAQVFITCVQQDELAGAWPDAQGQPMRMFHVEQGCVHAV
jgi:DNA replication and repair protein RecF